MRPLFTLTIFASSALLFVIQPIVGRMMLPAFGGAPAVWTTSLLFFQVLLLAGYAYAHFSLRRFGPRVQPWLHVGLFAGGVLACAPLTVRLIGGAERGEVSVLSVLATLGLAAGPLFFVLAAGSPLLQRWFALTGDRDGGDPYFLYASSNLGSLLGLLAYPFVVEPRLTLAEQANLVTFGAAAVGVLMALCGLAVARRPIPTEEPPPASTESGSARERLLWVALAAVPSSLLMSVTTYFTTDLTPVPLLWVVPLALYLLTFVAAFARRTLVGPVAVARAVPFLVVALGGVLLTGTTKPLFAVAALHLAVFTGLALALHLRLASLRPPSGRLTEFYLWLSFGGMLGGAFNALVAPLVFPTVLEYPIGLGLACLLLAPGPRSGPADRWDALVPLGIAVATAALLFAFQVSGVESGPLRTALGLGIPGALALLALARPPRLALSLAAVYSVTVSFGLPSDWGLLEVGRSFFGVHRVKRNDDGTMHSLLHGDTMHGRQWTDEARRRTPLAYYHPTGPIGQVFERLAETGPPREVGLVGLGVGSLVAYGRPGQRLTVYEIDPYVVTLARDRGWFSFLRDARCPVEIVIGDARLTLARSPRRFGLLVLDAFTSDSIPVHLLTREAFELYRSRLEPGGILAVHVSNRFLELRPVVASITASLGLRAWVNRDVGLSPGDLLDGKTASVWVIVTEREEDTRGLATAPGWEPLLPEPGRRPWTDDYAPVLTAIRGSL